MITVADAAYFAAFAFLLGAWATFMFVEITERA